MKAQSENEINNDSDDGGSVMDNRKLNDLIKNAMISKEDDKKKS
jgi:hypothetical protein